MSRYARRVDGNHASIVEAMRAAGASVVSLAAIGKGCPDLLVGVGGVDQLVEVKDGAKVASARKLGDAQVEFAATWRGRRVAVVTTLAEAIELVRAMRSWYVTAHERDNADATRGAAVE